MSQRRTCPHDRLGDLQAVLFRDFGALPALGGGVWRCMWGTQFCEWVDDECLEMFKLG
jgi:hypothetical protein